MVTILNNNNFNLHSLIVDDIFESVELDKGEWVENISKGETSIKELLASVDESISERSMCQF